ncbi:hypothetical protein JCM10908_000915 [Rhodotorula pacifica]|uniref:uncharacterized protein n=1 Tax=Rhodotorula pacifica TaxID=1495444 RepID=UPI0031769433
MVAAPETLVQPAAAQPPAPAHANNSDSPALHLNNAKKDVQQNGASVNEGAASPGAESSSSTSQANLPPAEVARNIPCRFFPLGQCKYGEHCIFSHGIPGTAGSPGVPPSPSVAAQVVPGQQQQQGQGAQRQEHSLAQASVPNHHLHQQQQQQPAHHFQHAGPQQHHQHHQFHPQQISMEQAYAMQAAGMPFYYPEQAGLEYGYTPQVAFGGPQPGYYYPPHFAPAAAAAGGYPGANVQPPFPPQPYYAGPVAQPPPPPPSHQQPVAAVEQQAPVSPPPAAVSPAQSAVATSPQPTEPTATDAPAEISAAESVAVAPLDPLAANGGVAIPPVASLHTFFQTGPPAAGMPPALLAAPNGAPYVKNGVPRGSMGPRRSIGGPNGGPLGGPGGKRASFGTARPPCSFFEANRCRHGDKCLFVHLLPDGSDARGLGRGLIGIDGRTEHPEATGGMPPAWLATQKAIKAANHTARKHHEQGTILNGGYSYRERMAAQPNGQEQAAPVPAQAPQETSAPSMSQEEEGASAAPAEGVQQSSAALASQEASAPVPAAPVQQAPQQQQQQQRPAQNGSAQRNGSLPPGSAAPQLVAAINGLTRRIPPAHINNKQSQVGPRQGQQQQQQNSSSAQHQQNGHKQQHQQQPKQQRIPSGENDFPALSPAAPSSPAFEKDGFAAALAAPAPTPAPVPASAPAPAAEKAVPVEEAAKPTSPSDETEGFVMVSHADAGVAAPADAKADAPAPAAAAAAPRPKLIGGWASAAARGASVVVPEKPKARAFSPVVANRAAAPAAEGKEAPATSAKKDESAPSAKKDSREREKTDEDGFVRQQPKRKGGAHKANKAAAHQQPVAIKA